MKLQIELDEEDLREALELLLPDKQSKEEFLNLFLEWSSRATLKQLKKKK